MAINSVVGSIPARRNQLFLFLRLANQSAALKTLHLCQYAINPRIRRCMVVCMAVVGGTVVGGAVVGGAVVVGCSVKLKQKYNL